MGSEITIFSFVACVCILECVLLAGVVPSTSVSYLFSQPPTYSSVGVWDVTGVATALWYGISLFIWLISKPFLFLAMMFEIMFFSSITVITIFNSLLLGTALTIAFIMYIKGWI